ncbi:MAG: SPOR domain-containing protein [Alphaproteobacteria bacterium]
MNLPGLDFLSSRDPALAVASDSAAAGAEPEKFRVGDRFAFDNPLVRWEVVSVEGERVYWRSDTGDEQVTRFNMLLPALEWRSRTAGTGRRFIRDEVGSLFPMKVGATLSFRSTVTTSKPPFGWEHHWSCKVTGQEDVRVLDNLFDTFVVACGRERPDEIVFYYAPKIGHYVVQRLAGAEGSPGRTRNMLSFERSDGTTLADVAKTPPEPVAAVPPGAGTPHRNQAVPPAPEPNPVTPPVRAAAPVNAAPAKDGALSSLSAAVDSVTLRAPEFGGNATPPASPTRPAAAPVAPVVPAIVPRADMKPATAGRDGKAPDAAASPKPRADRSRKSESSGPRTVAVPVPVPPPPTVPPPPVAVARPEASSATVTLPPPPQVPVPVAKAASEKPVAPSLQIPTPVAPQAPASVAAPLASAPPPVEAVPPPALVVPPVADVTPVPTAPAIPETKRPTGSPVPAAQGVHLASYRNLANARQGWAQLVHRNGDLLEGLQADIRRIEIDSRGIYYRLYAGPVDSADAEALCEKLRTRGIFCAPQEG